MTNSNLNKNIQYWLKGAEKELQVAGGLFRLKHYPQCLFFCHLAIEKILKAIITKRAKIHPPYIHDLRRLAEFAKVKFNQKQIKILDKLSTFNIAGRYTDRKFEFYKSYNRKEIAQKYLKTTKDLFSWLKKEFPKK